MSFPLCAYYGMSAQHANKYLSFLISLAWIVKSTKHTMLEQVKYWHLTIRKITQGEGDKFFISILWLQFFLLIIKYLMNGVINPFFFYLRFVFITFWTLLWRKKSILDLFSLIIDLFSYLIQVFQNYIIISKYTLTSITIVVVGWVGHN
jgi:hypothetical protein